MPGLFVFIASPLNGSTVGRTAQLRGSIGGAGSGGLTEVSIQFGVGGPVVALANSADWSWQGDVPNYIRPGQAFRITVRAEGYIQTAPYPEPEYKDVNGEAVLDVMLENVVPVLTVNAFQSPMAVEQLPMTFTLAGTVSQGNGPPYAVPRLQVQVGSAPWRDVAVAAGRWSLALSLSPGDHPITVRASDAFDSVTSFQKTLTVLRYTRPEPADPGGRTTLAGAPTTASVTGWTRLEPQCSGADPGLSARARLFDPLWLLTRQWQLGEFQGEDTGTPVQACVRATSAALTRSHLGALAENTPGMPYDPARVPLEVLVERRRMRAASSNDARMLPLAVEAGQFFLRRLEMHTAGRKYRAAFLARYALQASATEADAATLRLTQTMAGRAPDARRLADAFRRAPGQTLVFDAALNIVVADLAALRQLADNWLAWYDGLCSEPAGSDAEAWWPERLEYGVSVATRLSAQPDAGLTLTATEFAGGRLDWSSFDLDTRRAIDTTGEYVAVAVVETSVPSPVTFRGAPAPRFWELEDAQVAYGLLSAGPTDQAQLMMVEYAGSYGNDWFVVPLTLKVGTVTQVDSLVVTDTFGVRSLLRPIGDPALPTPHFSMWQPATLRRAGEPAAGPVANRYFLPPTLGRSLDGAPLEEVMLLRDEMANLAWGIERQLEGPLEQPLPSRPASQAAPPVPAAVGSELPLYRLASPAPEHWIPLLPVQLDNGGERVNRLRRGVMRAADGSMRMHPARSEALNTSRSLLLFDEEVPREGVRITRRRRMTRWIDGSTWLWTAFRNEVGRGEGSAGLRFDALEGDE